ncbi:hypothetical protein ZIOFF_013720 [Zingiber officinale]|uniref:Mediator of RNA polymerase II transcription subunit 25 n=1 Tax=Zingiber officinale TaxID=94328 RepID=A0A8J5HUS1_ZINOF|nr:hypothetical protein ZIOFF_013720 [Zingiber officinale]
MCFSGGGFSEAAIAEGLSEALMMFPVSINASDNHQIPEVQKHCILVAASNPYPLPTPVYRPPVSSLEHKENTEVQTESFLADAETVAKSFSQCFVSLSETALLFLPFASCFCLLFLQDLPRNRFVIGFLLHNFTLTKTLFSNKFICLAVSKNVSGSSLLFP